MKTWAYGYISDLLIINSSYRLTLYGVQQLIFQYRYKKNISIINISQLCLALQLLRYGDDIHSISSWDDLCTNILIASYRHEFPGRRLIIWNIHTGTMIIILMCICVEQKLEAFFGREWKCWSTQFLQTVDQTPAICPSLTQSGIKFDSQNTNQKMSIIVDLLYTLWYYI